MYFNANGSNVCFIEDLIPMSGFFTSRDEEEEIMFDVINHLYYGDVIGFKNPFTVKIDLCNYINHYDNIIKVKQDFEQYFYDFNVQNPIINKIDGSFVNWLSDQDCVLFGGWLRPVQMNNWQAYFFGGETVTSYSHYDLYQKMITILEGEEDV